MSTYKKELGKWGEDQSYQYLIDNGYRIVYQNYRCPLGEIDIVASKDSQLIFVEVKTRRSTSFGTPAEAVNYRKQMKYHKTALHFINESKSHNSSYRFDIMEVVVKQNDTFDINHIINAFQPTSARYYF